MAVSLTLTILGALLAAPFAWTILHAETPGQVLWQWLALLATALALWLLCTLVFHSGLIAEQRSRVLAAAIINALWAALVLAVALGAVTAVIQALRLRAGLRTGK